MTSLVLAQNTFVAGVGRMDDAADPLMYLVATRPRTAETEKVMNQCAVGMVVGPWLTWVAVVVFRCEVQAGRFGNLV